MKLRSIILFLILAGCANLQAQDREHTVSIKTVSPIIKTSDSAKDYEFQIPDQKIVTQPTVEQGELVMASVSPITSPPAYLVAATYRWRVLENGAIKQNVKEWPDGSSVMFGAGIIRAGDTGRKFTVIASVSYLYLAKEKDIVASIGQRSALLIAEITVNGGIPGPAPGPAPTPAPDGSRFGLTAKVYNLAMSVSEASRAQGARVLANSFNGIAASVAAGTLTDVKLLLAQSKTANQTALSNGRVSALDWDNFFTGLQKEIYPLYSSGKMTTVRDFADAWKEVAAGLEKVR